MPIIPNTSQPGYILESVGDGQNSSVWTQASIVPDSGNYVLQGALVTGAIQAFTKRVLPGSQVTLTSIVCWIGSGTSATFTAYQNGSPLSWATAAVATTSSESTPLAPSSPIAVADLDEFYFNITALSGAPVGMTVCFVFEVSGAIGSGGAQGPAGTNGTNGLGYSGVTSTTSNTIGTGSATWLSSNTGAYAVGDRVRVVNSTTEYEEGVITSLTTNTSITVNVDLTLGSGTYTSWTFSLAGNPGLVQSVAAGTNVTITGTSTNPIINASGGGGGGSTPNLITNGAMAIAQRGTTFSASGSTTYGLDRWCFQSSGSNTTFAQSSSSPPTGFKYFQSVTETSITSSTWYLSQSMETNDVVLLQGQAVTVSFWYKMPVNFTNAVTLSLRYSTGTDVNLLNAGTAVTITAGSNVNTSTGAITNNSGWTLATATFTVPSTATSLALQFSSATDIVGTAQFDVTGVMLQLGSTATTFTLAGGDYQGELARCQRYYYEVNSANANDVYCVYGTGQCIATTAAYIQVYFPVTMRAAPAFSSTAASSFAAFSSAGGVIACTVIGLVRDSPSSAWLNINMASGVVAGNATFLFSNNNNTSNMAFSAEL